MKVTQAMLDAAKRAAPELPIVSLDDALHAALADVPEPDEMDARAFQALGRKLHQAERQAEYNAAVAAKLADQVNAAEAKLAKVREWELLNNGIHNAAWRDLVEILDGEL